MRWLKTRWIVLRYGRAINYRLAVARLHIWLHECLTRLASALLTASSRFGARAAAHNRRAAVAIDDYQERLRAMGIPVALDVDGR